MMTRTTLNKKGQAITEFALFSWIAFLAVGLAFLLLKQFWLRTQCAYMVFETTHLKLIGRDIKTRDVSISENDRRVEGHGQCGSLKENVVLPKLETAKW